jgi:hypothetical protein
LFEVVNLLLGLDLPFNSAFESAGGTGDDAFARGDEVRFEAAVAGGSAGREVGDAVRVRALAVSGADGDGNSELPGSLMLASR